MKKIILIGDSIRMGYDKYVKEALNGVAQVYYPEENCRFALNVLRLMTDWKRKGEWPDDVDVVHWNAGLWDVLEQFGEEPLCPIEFYAYTVARIDKRLRRLFPKAKMVFATSTAVWEEKCSYEFKRHNNLIREYNKAAIEALANTDTVIDDLYSVTEGLTLPYHSDATHYNTPEGRELVGGKVVAALCEITGIEPSEVNIENFKPENYSKENIGN